LGRGYKRHFVRTGLEIAALALILSFLSTPLVNVTSSPQAPLASSAQPTLASSAKQASASSDEPAFESVYLMKFIVHTNSDLTTVYFNGTSPFANNASITLGADAPGLMYSSQPGYISISKNVLDTTPVSLETWFLTFEGADKGVVSIDKGSLGITSVNISYYANSWSSLDNFSATVPENFILDYSPMYSLPSGNATVDPVPSALNRSVLAFYYSWYLTLNGPGGMTSGTDRNYAHHPLFGKYDSVDERVIEAHIRMAKACGIDGFIVSFWSPGGPEEKAVPAILRIADSLNFSISFYYETDADGDSPTVNGTINRLSYMIETYSSHKSFLKVNGMPVIFIYSVMQGNRNLSFWLNVTKGLRTKGDPAYLVGDLGPYPEYYSEFAPAFDGIHYYYAPNATTATQAFDLDKENMRLGFKGIDWDEAIALIMQGKNVTLEDRFIAFTVEPGYDHTKIGSTLYLDRQDGKTYEDWWQAALSENPDGILITTWNEWLEGGEIEPSVEYGFTYLNLTRQFVSEYKGSSIPTYATKLALQSDMGTVLPAGRRNVSVRLINNSSYPAIGVNLTLRLGEGLTLQTVERSTFYAYLERNTTGEYSVLIPFLNSSETLTFNMTVLASTGTSELNVSAIGYSSSGAPSQASFEKSVQIVTDWVPIVAVGIGLVTLVLVVVVLVVRKRKR
jgi:hypothetical protein